LALRKGRFDTDLSAWGAQLTSPLGVPGGDLHVLVDQAVLQGGWPLELQASAHWQQAFVRTAKGESALGDWHVHAQARQGVIEAQFEDDGVGPLQGNGQLQLSVLGWRFEATLKPRHANLALRQWLQQLGKPAADGSVHIQHRGGLGA
ncbi:MAG: type II secretion system protein N, partial [Rhodanobacter sp.]